MLLNLPSLPILESPCGCRTGFVRRGSFRRKSDRARIQRYQCIGCHRSFSEATSSPCFNQKKRQFNVTIFKLLTGGYSQRRAALDLRINRKTVVRTFLLLGRYSHELLFSTNLEYPLAKTFQFDDLETFEHSKCKPLSVTLAVEQGSRRILGFRVAQMPAKGKLAELARKRYGKRQDHRSFKRADLFSELQHLVAPDAIIKSDQSPHYPEYVKRFFPGCTHQAYKGRRGCVVGQGELKRGGFDPIYSLNHTCAMLRANINRLFRKTWCTTKLAERLSCHIAIYSLRHNLDLI